MQSIVIHHLLIGSWQKPDSVSVTQYNNPKLFLEKKGGKYCFSLFFLLLKTCVSLSPVAHSTVWIAPFFSSTQSAFTYILTLPLFLCFNLSAAPWMSFNQYGRNGVEREMVRETDEGSLECRSIISRIGLYWAQSRCNFSFSIETLSTPAPSYWQPKMALLTWLTTLSTWQKA